MKPVTGKMSYKTYECMTCGKRSEQQTNHWGEIYSQCTACGQRRMFCTEDPPEGFGDISQEGNSNETKTH